MFLLFSLQKLELMLDTDSKDAFLKFIRLGIGTDETLSLKNHVDWDAVEAIAERQGLLGVVFDGVKKLKDSRECAADSLPSQVTWLCWMGKVMQGYEQRSVLYKKAVASLAAFYNTHGFKMMVLKGLACGLNWPQPEHRPYGDIDIYLFGKQKEADKALARFMTDPHNQSNGGSLLPASQDEDFKIDNSHHHHSVFNWKGFTVENHYDFMNVHHHKSNAEIERVLKELAQDDSHFVELHGERVYLPSANLHALFLQKHAMAHFAAVGISLRHLLDWGLYVKAHTDEIDWNWLDGALEKYGMKPAFNIFNAICVEDLGFEARLFPEIQPNPSMKDAVLNEIISPAFSKTLPEGLVGRVIYKTRRWRGNAWKHKLCYKDSMWSAFWSGVWNHLLKPSSI